MEGFTIIDAVVAAVVIVSAVLAYSRMKPREVLAIGGWIAAAVVAYIFAPQAVPLIKEIPYLSDFLSESCELSTIASFAAVGAVALLVVSIFTPLFSSAVQRSALGGVDQILGFLFGVARGLLIVAIAFVLYGRFMSGSPVQLVDDSRSAKVFLQVQDQLNEQIPQDAPGWILDQYNNLIVKSCGALPNRPVAPVTPPADGAATGDAATGTGATPTPAPTNP
jgi:membrane protein required for colicin V production